MSESESEAVAQQIAYMQGLLEKVQREEKEEVSRQAAADFHWQKTGADIRKLEEELVKKRKWSEVLAVSRKRMVEHLLDDSRWWVDESEDPCKRCNIRRVLCEAPLDEGLVACCQCAKDRRYCSRVDDGEWKGKKREWDADSPMSDTSLNQDCLMCEEWEACFMRLWEDQHEWDAWLQELEYRMEEGLDGMSEGWAHRPHIRTGRISFGWIMDQSGPPSFQTFMALQHMMGEADAAREMHEVLAELGAGDWVDVRLSNLQFEEGGSWGVEDSVAGPSAIDISD
ncbi:hypothetical protein FISHEDRAFT_68668 [Fistulina hepatica ATCC 64428]|uniref:Uncharacterized protein n=1 Tax=Fistulina hepatica ATCC 64428 TaxID=1128425 RepID=A0A0D7APK4_9AGAR|nr:hypothetical protein FISHEDRAFT_68668 [Fistulina hepatica ATCC 64428]